MSMTYNNANVLTRKQIDYGVKSYDYNMTYFVNVQAIIDGLSPTMPEKRRDVVKNAASLVGKVNYFWGGKSSAIGWDP